MVSIRELRAAGVRSLSPEAFHWLCSEAEKAAELREIVDNLEGQIDDLERLMIERAHNEDTQSDG